VSIFFRCCSVSHMTPCQLRAHAWWLRAHAWYCVMRDRLVPVVRWLVARIRREMKKLIIGVTVVVLLFLLYYIPSAIRRDAERRRIWEGEDGDQPPVDGQCRRTPLFPFVKGCPARCEDYRPDLLRPIPPMYQSDLAWSLHPNNATRRVSAYIPTSAYVPTSAVTSGTVSGIPAPRAGSTAGLPSRYQALEYALTDYIYRRGLHPSSGGPLRVQVESHLRLTLAYFCCLTEVEAYILQQSAEEWVWRQNLESKIHLQFVPKRLECWHQDLDSLASILVVDQDSNRRLLRIHDDLLGHLRAKSIPVVLRRQQQMPFHVTLAVINTADGTNISPHVPAIEDVMKQLQPKAKALGLLGREEHNMAAPEMSEPRPMS
jgi:hypothetical protein